MKKQSRDLGPADRAVYELVRSGVLNAAHAPLYRRQIAALAAAGLITRDAAGRFVDAAPSALIPAAAPPEPVMVTLVVRVPPALLAEIDAKEGMRSEVVRRLLVAGLAKESGVMRLGSTTKAS